MVGLQPLVSEFTIVGQLKDFTISSKARVKYLHLSTAEAEYSIKVAKEQKTILSQHLTPGCWLKITGMKKHELHKEQVKYKAYRIELLAEHLPNTLTTSTPRKVKVLFCQSSNCWKKGGKTACEILQAELRSQGIEDRVEIKTSGCLKQCKQAPNLIIMPGGNRYSRVRPKNISRLISQYLPSRE